MADIAWVVTDVEGTTTPISFVRDVLFPYARQALPEMVAHPAAEGASTPETTRAITAALAEVARLAPGVDPLSALLGWMDADAKITPLKDLQGIAWRVGYSAGAIKGEVYADVPPALRAWSAAGIGLAVYSSGSVQAQKLLFAHSTAGDLAGLFSAHFDTTIGGKREAASYAAIARALATPPERILFLSDIAAELDAAAAAGLHTCQLVRPLDGTRDSYDHIRAADFPGVAAMFGLPL